MIHYSKNQKIVHDIPHHVGKTTHYNSSRYLSSKIRLLTIAIGFSVFINTNVIAESPCCGEKKHDSASCSKNHKDVAYISGCVSLAKSTSGCAPSGGRGAKNKIWRSKGNFKFKKQPYLA